jgi:hypothetical protein
MDTDKHGFLPQGFGVRQSSGACGHALLAMTKRQGAAAVQDAGANLNVFIRVHPCPSVVNLI